MRFMAEKVGDDFNISNCNILVDSVGFTIERALHVIENANSNLDVIPVWHLLQEISSNLFPSKLKIEGKSKDVNGPYGDLHMGSRWSSHYNGEGENFQCCQQSNVLCCGHDCGRYPT
ncbi:hypothetical protein GOP47_0020183 [Adiantum capillus-veneris]|uniref:Uncharacterized protein n=1 Tax=Adiantum capillus-veneris TaxID=13818 RepID=A0A9D4UCH7_ADICA|nr:hypothetical protein GOP47_0020183 [Adiantum capillus-veneris]